MRVRVRRQAARLLAQTMTMMLAAKAMFGNHEGSIPARLLRHHHRHHHPAKRLQSLWLQRLRLRLTLHRLMLLRDLVRL